MNEEPSVQSTERKLPTIYIGPTSSKLGLVKFTHYIEFNDNVKEAIQRIPALKILFIPLEEFRARATEIYANRDASVTHAIQRLIKDEVL
jgi:hypothetical protein